MFFRKKDNVVIKSIKFYNFEQSATFLFQSGNGFGRLPEPLQTVAGEYCPANYPVSQTSTSNEKLHTGE